MALALTLPLTLLLGACGQRGPLYLPSAGPAAAKPAPAASVPAAPIPAAPSPNPSAAPRAP